MHTLDTHMYMCITQTFQKTHTTFRSVKESAQWLFDRLIAVYKHDALSLSRLEREQYWCTVFYVCYRCAVLLIIAWHDRVYSRIEHAVDVVATSTLCNWLLSLFIFSCVCMFWHLFLFLNSHRFVTYKHMYIRKAVTIQLSFSLIDCFFFLLDVFNKFFIVDDIDICSWPFAYFQRFELFILILTKFQSIQN